MWSASAKIIIKTIDALTDTILCSTYIRQKSLCSVYPLYIAYYLTVTTSLIWTWILFAKISKWSIWQLTDERYKYFSLQPTQFKIVHSRQNHHTLVLLAHTTETSSCFSNLQTDSAVTNFQYWSISLKNCTNDKSTSRDHNHTCDSSISCDLD